ncbi:MAG: glycosyltransferase family 4 protein [Bacteroidales bacterium]|nr:glycosyltransferase family 4 protein [Bacteroidales bacterium]
MEKIQKNKMRIIFLSHLFPDNYDPSGGIFNLERIKALQNTGCEVEMIAPRSVIPPSKYFFPIPKLLFVIRYFLFFVFIKKEIIYNDIKVHNIKWTSIPKAISWLFRLKLLHFFAGKKIKKIIQNFNPDLIICSVAHPEGTYSKYIKKYCDAKIIVIAEGTELLVDPESFKGVDKIIEIINKNADYFVFVSGYIYQAISKKFEIRNPVIIKNGYNSDVFKYIEAIKNKEKKIFNLISVGSLEHIKGQDLLIDAVAEIKNINLTLVGIGDLKEKYEEIILKKGIKERVKIKGHQTQTQIRELYKDADIFCLPSRSESFGIAAIEAMACGLPVVATKVGEMPCLIKNGINGYLAEINSVESIKKNIILAIETKWNNKRIASEIEDNYSWDKWAKKINKIYYDN